MKKLLYFSSAVLLIIGGYGCSEEEMANYTDSSLPAPIQVSNITATETPGGAILTYKIPEDPNLAYVKAVYEIQPGVFREAKSSIYTDTLSLVGFGDTLSHEVNLYSVGKNEKSSEPVSIVVNPLTPPVKSVFETLNLEATFGGVNVKFQNDFQADLAIVLMVDSTEMGNWSPVTTFYTGAKEGSFSARGFESKEKKFAVFIRDRWNNKSDSLIKALVPLYEELIPKSGFRAVNLPTDSWLPVEPGLTIEKMWDDKFEYNAFATPQSNTMPQWFTLDLGKEIILSRLKMHSVSGHSYNGGGVKSFEIWGSLAPNPDGSWDSWELLEAFEAFKPSGLPAGQRSPEDVNYAAVLGDDFEFSNALPPIRYIRFKTFESYGGSGQLVISELTFWGQIQ